MLPILQLSNSIFVSHSRTDSKIATLDVIENDPFADRIDKMMDLFTYTSLHSEVVISVHAYILSYQPQKLTSQIFKRKSIKAT